MPKRYVCHCYTSCKGAPGQQSYQRRTINKHRDNDLRLRQQLMGKGLSIPPELQHAIDVWAPNAISDEYEVPRHASHVDFPLSFFPHSSSSDGRKRAGTEEDSLYDGEHPVGSKRFKVEHSQVPITPERMLPSYHPPATPSAAIGSYLTPLMRPSPSGPSLSSSHRAAQMAAQSPTSSTSSSSSHGRYSQATAYRPPLPAPPPPFARAPPPSREEAYGYLYLPSPASSLTYPAPPSLFPPATPTSSDCPHPYPTPLASQSYPSSYAPSSSACSTLSSSPSGRPCMDDSSGGNNELSTKKIAALSHESLLKNPVYRELYFEYHALVPAGLPHSTFRVHLSPQSTGGQEASAALAHGLGEWQLPLLSDGSTADAAAVDALLLQADELGLLDALALPAGSPADAEEVQIDAPLSTGPDDEGLQDVFWSE